MSAPHREPVPLCFPCCSALRTYTAAKKNPPLKRKQRYKKMAYPSKFAAVYGDTQLSFIPALKYPFFYSWWWLLNKYFVVYFCDLQILTTPLSPNESFLRYLTLPQDNDLAIDLRQTAVVIMAHLDRLASPCSPPHCNSPTTHKVWQLFLLVGTAKWIFSQVINLLLLSSIFINNVPVWSPFCCLYNVDNHWFLFLGQYNVTNIIDTHGHLITISS